MKIKYRYIKNESKAIIMIAFLFLLLYTAMSGCKSKNQVHTGDNDILAEVYDRYLKKNDIDIKYLSGLKKEDSINLVHSYVEHWIRKELLAHNAEKYVKNKEKINRLVKDYRNSLLVEAFQKQYIEENLDSQITKQQLKQFYDDNKDNFHLDHDVVRFVYAKIDAKKKHLDKFYENWKNNKYNPVYRYGSKNSKKYFLKINKWYDLEEMKKEIPGFLRKKARKYEVQKNVKGYEYFFKVLETRYKNEIAPLSLIEDKLKKLIIEKRKSRLIDDYIEKIYKKEIKNNNIKIYN